MACIYSANQKGLNIRIVHNYCIVIFVTTEGKPNQMRDE